MKMIDREKVIDDLQDAVNDDWMWQHADYYALTMERAIALLKEQGAREQCLKTKCVVCPHCDNCDVDDNGLLKAQEAKTGTWQWKIHGKAESGGTLGEAICDQCGKSTYATAVKGDLNYCPNCGAKMTDRR